MRYRVEQLASSCAVSVDTVRYYQSRGLLPQPEREGRVAWYGPEHAERIRQIRSLQTKGLTLAAIRRVVTGELGAADADLAAAVAAARGDGGANPELLTLEAFSERSGVPASLIQAVELFDEHVRKPIRDTAGDDDRRAAAQMVEAFAQLLPAVTQLVSDHFRRVLLETAEEHIEEPA